MSHVCQRGYVRGEASPAGGAGLDLAGGEADREVGDEGVLGLSRAVAGHHTPAGLLGHLHRLDRLCHCSDLVHLSHTERCTRY